MPRLTRPLLLALFTVATAAPAQNNNVATPDPATVAAAARATADKLRTAPAAWKVSIQTEGKVTVSAEVLQTPTARRVIYRAHDPNRGDSDLATVIETPDAWHVAEGLYFRKHRPYEADFGSPIISVLRALIEPRFATQDDLKSFGNATARDGDVARYTAPAPNPGDLRRNIALLDERLKAAPTTPAPTAAAVTAVKDKLNQLKRALDKGLPVAVDARTGIVTEYFTAKYPVTLTDFTFNAAPREADLSTSDHAWKDLAAEPLVAAAKPNDLAMICRAPASGIPAIDCLLLDLASGRVRRLPFRGGQTVPGCFVKDRTAVVVPGIDLLDGESHLWEIDLKTGANRRFNAGPLAYGSTEAAVLSPDGKTLAARHKPDPTRLREYQILLIDLATGQPKPLGAPGNHSYLNWLPDGQGFILASGPSTADPAAAAEAAPLDVCRMDLAGNLTPLFKGSSPVLVQGGKAILFLQPARRRWYLCDLDGKNPRPLGDGLPRFSLPSPSPDGAKALMMPNVTGRQAPPALVDLTTGKTEPVPIDPGVWTLPTWR